MSNCEPNDEVEVLVALHVDEDSGCIRLEMNPRPQTLEATEEFEKSTPMAANTSLQNNAENVEDVLVSSTIRKTDREKQSTTAENHVEAVSTNTQLFTDQSQSIESQSDFKDACFDRLNSVNQTKLRPALSSHCPSYAEAIHSAQPRQQTQTTEAPSRNLSQNLKNIQTTLTNALEERRCKAVPRELRHDHRYFFPGTRSETLEKIRRVAVNGTEALQNRLRVAVLRENELRMDAEMARAEIEAAKTEKALAEILLEDTKHHEAMLQKDLENAVTELQRGPSRDSKTSSQSNGVLKQELQAIREAIDLERQKREQSESETRFFVRELQERQSTKTYIAQLEDEVRSLRKELSKIHSTIDNHSNVFHPAQRVTDRDEHEMDNIECKYRPDRPNWCRSASRGETDRPSRSRRHRFVHSNTNRQYTKYKPHPSHHKRSTSQTRTVVLRTEVYRSRTSSGEDVETQQKAEDPSLFSTGPPLLNSKLDYIPPVPPTRVTTEALRKARQDYMKETKRMQDRWQEITNQR